MGAKLTEWPSVPCCTGDETHCVCLDMERALRGWVRGDAIPPMTTEQRASCLSEIGRVEGYRQADHESEPDAQLARTVLSAWTDYARDKGLL